MSRIARVLPVIASLLLALAHTASAQDVKRITIIYDAFGAPSSLVKDWGFAAFVEYGGKRILFDTGNNAKIFEHNVKQLGIDLTRLDAVVISHRHGDHTTGLTYLLEVNSAFKIYARSSGAQPIQVFSSLIQVFLRNFVISTASLPPWVAPQGRPGRKEISRS